MLNKGEYYFNTFEEACDFVCNPTNYEKDHNIKLVNKRMMLDVSDLKVMRFEKSDGTETVVIFFKNSKKYDIWKFWIPSELQQKLLPHVAEILKNIDLHNQDGKKQ
jgi:hypothetical protein